MQITYYDHVHLSVSLGDCMCVSLCLFVWVCVPEWLCLNFLVWLGVCDLVCSCECVPDIEFIEYGNRFNLL